MQQLDFFIDCHHHMFTIPDFPLYQTIRQTAHDKLNLSTRLAIPILLSFYLPPFNPEKKVMEYKKFITFFENEPEKNVGDFVDEVLNFIDGKEAIKPPFTVGSHILLTPLVMDMDIGGGVNKLRGQIGRLTAASRTIKDPKVKMLPFIGIDPRRTEEPTTTELKEPTIRELLDWVTPIRKIPGGFEGAENGTFIGIKLYPSLGFNPRDHIGFCENIADREIPVTVHCQQGSLRLVNDADDLNHPENWEQVLEALNGKGKELIINFGHFGGEDEVTKTIGFQRREDTEVGRQ